MKNLLLLVLSILGLTSCSKDSLDLNFEQQGPEKSEIMVRVSYLAWSEYECEPGCGTSSQVVFGLANAKVELFQGQDIENDVEISPLLKTVTNREGYTLLVDINPDTYTLRVETTMGIKLRTVTTQYNKRSNIDFSF